MKLRLETMKIKHFVNFMEHKRPADIKEVELMTELNFGDIPVLDYADATVLVDDNDAVYAIGGVQEVVEDDYKLNIVWMLCTDKVEQHQIAFLRATKDLLATYLDKYTHLANWVWLGNEQHVKWLKWLGAQFFDIQQQNGEDFQCFVFVKKEDS